MGYTTDFSGQFNLNKKLDPEMHQYLVKFSETRRMKRNLPPCYGIEGEHYVDGSGPFGQGREDNIVEYNQPPRTQPGLWCQWRPSQDGKSIVWDGGEKFYHYIEWLQYIISNYLSPKGYVLNGEVEWQGESEDDTGVIVVKHNEIEIL